MRAALDLLIWLRWLQWVNLIAAMWRMQEIAVKEKALLTDTSLFNCKPSLWEGEHIAVLPGQIKDSETGFYYNGHRYYSAELGRYITVDPLGLDGGDFSPYVYAHSQPTRFVDPSGLRVSPGFMPGITTPTSTISISPGVGVRLSTPSGAQGYGTGDPRGLYSCSGTWSNGQCYPSLGPPPTRGELDSCSKDNNDECEKKRELEEGLCEAIAIQWGKQGVAICKTSAFTRYSECLRYGPGGVRTPLHGVDTPL
jgi:RHS repeat-associated protein